MASSQKRSRPLRRVVRTFFAHRFWLVAMVIGASLAAALVSMRQPKMFVGRMELASAANSTSSSVLLPDVVRLRQLVFNPENLAALVVTTPGGEARDAKLISRIAKSVQLEPVSDPALGSGVWRLRVEIPAADAATAAERLDRYAQSIDEEFRLRVRLAKKDSTASQDDPASWIAPVAHTQAAAGQTDETFADPLLEVVGNPEDVEPLAAAIQADIDRACAELDRQSRELEALTAIVEQLDANPAAVEKELEAEQPALRALRNERDRLLEQRARLAAYLRPAHPDYQAIDRRIQSAEDALAQERAKLRELYGQKRQQVQSAVEKRTAQLEEDRKRLAVVERPFRTEKAARNAPANSETPRPLPEVPARALDANLASLDRPVGRVVLPSPSVDPRPIQPMTARNVLLAAMAALAVYLLFVVVRAGADSRIHSMDDLEDLDVDLYAFGSIPTRRSGMPVRLRAAAHLGEPRS